MTVLAIAVYVGRSLYLDNLPSEIRSPAAAAAVFDTVVAPLRASLRAVFVVGLVVAIGAYLSGGSTSAVAIRRSLDLLRRSGRTRTPTIVESWITRLRKPLRAAIVAGAFLVVVFWNYPTGAVVGWIVLIALVLLLLVEFVVRPFVASQHETA